MYRTAEDVDSPGVAFRIPANTRATDFERYRVQWRNLLSIRQSVDLALGVEGLWEIGEASAVFDHSIRPHFSHWIPPYRSGSPAT